MKKNLPLYILLIFLIVVNAFFLYNYLGSGVKDQETKERKPPGSFLVKELGFDDAQKDQFIALTREHHQKTRRILDEVRVLKDELFMGLSDASLESVNTDSIASLIGENEKRKELLTFEHFSEVQKLCNAEQKQKFSKIIKDALRRVSRDEGPHEGRPDGDKPENSEGFNGNRPPPSEH